MNNFKEQLDSIVKKHQEIEKNLSNQENLDSTQLIQLNKEYSELIPIVELINKLNSNKKDIENLNSLLNDQDISIRGMAEEELRQKKKKIKLLKQDLLRQLIPKDVNDKKNSILEIRAGTGGDEASLFAADLFSMYKKYSDMNKWKFEIMSISETGLKGIKEIICNVSGKNVFFKIKI